MTSVLSWVIKLNKRLTFRKLISSTLISQIIAWAFDCLLVSYNNGLLTDLFIFSSKPSYWHIKITATMHEKRDVFSSMSALMDKNSRKEFDAATTHGVFFFQDRSFCSRYLAYERLIDLRRINHWNWEVWDFFQNYFLLMRVDGRFLWVWSGITNVILILCANTRETASK